MPPAPEQMLCITRLPPELKRQVWAFIKAERPATATLLANEDPDSPLAELAKLLPGSEMWIPVTDTGLSPQALASLSVSMVSWRGAGISLPISTACREDDTSSGLAPKARSNAQSRR